MPTFCEKDEKGVVENTEAKAEPKPSHNIPLDNFLPVNLVFVTFDKAKKSPVDSTMVTK